MYHGESGDFEAQSYVVYTGTTSCWAKVVRTPSTGFSSLVALWGLWLTPFLGAVGYGLL